MVSNISQDFGPKEVSVILVTHGGKSGGSGGVEVGWRYEIRVQREDGGLGCG